MDNTFDLLISQLASLKNCIISAHISPDVDAVGSAVGLARGLASLGIPSKVYLHDPIPERLLPLVKNVSVVHEIPAESYSAAIVVDTATANRVGEDHAKFLQLGTVSYNIDHHISNPLYADINYVDVQASASAAMVYRILRSMGATIDADTANLLYAGILDDTGCFRFSNTNAQALTYAAELINLGASPEAVSNIVYFSQPKEAIELRAKAISSMKTICDGKVALVSVSAALLAECGAKPEHTEGIVDEARSVDSVLGAVMLRERDKGKWKASLRSKTEKFNVNRVAAQLGGGGHAMAAGGMLFGTLEEAEAKLSEAIVPELP